MKANELRIGNWVNSQFGGIQQVVDVMCDGVNTLKYEGINYEFIDPIPLAEEWLLKFGFELINNEFYRSRNSELFLYWTINKNKMIPEYNEKRFVTGYDFKYVHQLQNLYFALTGEELTLKNEDR